MIVCVEFPDGTEAPDVLVRDALRDFVAARSSASYVETRYPQLSANEAAVKRQKVERRRQLAREAVVWVDQDTSYLGKGFQ